MTCLMEGLIADDVTSAYVSIQISGSSGGENVKKKKKEGKIQECVNPSGAYTTALV